MPIPELWQHQKEAIEKAGNKFALFFDPGCGKSRTAIELYKRSGERRAVIFAPLNVCRNWQNELAEYLGSPYEIFLVAGQTKTKKIGILEDFIFYDNKKHAFLICNIEALRSDEYRGYLERCNVKFIIVDESHNFRSHSSLQTKGLFEIVTMLEPTHIYLLTGTPAPQGEIDLWSTFKLLDKTPFAFFPWRKIHFHDKNERRRGQRNYWPEYEVTNYAKAEFQKLLSECSITARKDEVLDLPPFLRTQVYCEMGSEQRRHYETMKDYLFAIDSDGNELNASNVLVRTLRLQQILAGFLGEVSVKENPRLDALKFAIEKTNCEQFIIWTIFKSTYRQLSELLDELGISFGLVTGEQPPEDRHETIASFQNKEIRALIAHPKAGGVGVNLTAASYSIHYTRNFSLVDDLQAEARNYRGGSEIHKRITRIDIVTPDTIDEEITTALREKKSVQDFILGLKEQHG